MFFIALILFAALFIESIGTYISVAGLGHLFNMNPVIILMAIALDIGKVVGVSFVYKYWKETRLLMKAFMIPATAVLMLITSTGVFGYLSQQFQHAIVTNNQDTIIITSLEDEKARLQTRKQEIDKQIANLPADYARARRQLMQEFAPESDKINKRLTEIDTELPQLKAANVKKSADLGPILYVAEAFNTTPEKAVKYVIMTIIFVFDPLAIVLLIAANFLIERRKPKVVPITEPDPDFKMPTLAPPAPAEDAVTNEQVDSYYKEQVEKAGDPDAVLNSSFSAEDLQKGMDELVERGEMTSVDLNQESPPGWADRMAEEAQAGINREALPEELGREVITLPQLVQPRSSLESVDGRRADVIMSLDSDETRPTVASKYNDA